jgi:hypothetical protein
MKWSHVVLALACLGVIALRLFIAFSSPGFSGDDAYFHLRQVGHIREHGVPLFDDPLSYGGRTYVFSPVFQYLVAAGALVMPVETAGKVIPNVFATLLMVIIYGIVSRLSKREGVALFTAIFSAFVPVWFSHTVNTLAPVTLAIPLLFFVIYAWLRAKEPRWRTAYVAGLIVLGFTHPLSLLFVLGLILYIILLLVEHLEIERTEFEITLFSIFFVLWSQFLLYKKFILAHGPGVIWQNIPPGLLSSLFSEVTILTAIYQIGILPVLYGMFVVYRYLFRRKHKLTYFLISFAIAAAFLLWFRLIPLQSGLILLGMFLLVLFSRWIDFFFGHIPKTRFQRLQPVVVLGLVVAFIFTGVLPALSGAWGEQSKALSPDGMRVFVKIREQAPPDSVVVAVFDEGHRVAALAQRKNVIDDHFVLQHDAKQRLQDVNRIFGTRFGVEAAELMERYGANIILLSPETKRRFGIETLSYAERSACFARMYADSGYEVFVKHPFCRVEVIS